jgi:hypothetical protein
LALLYNYNQLRQLTINDCLRLTPFLTGLRVELSFILRPKVSRPVWVLRPDLYYCLTVAGLLIWGALSNERMGLSFTIAADLASAVFLGSESLGTRDHILLSQI